MLLKMEIFPVDKMSDSELNLAGDMRKVEPKLVNWTESDEQASKLYANERKAWLDVQWPEESNAKAWQTKGEKK